MQLFNNPRPALSQVEVGAFWYQLRYGVAERVNRTIMDRVRSTLVATNQPRLLWAHIAGHVVHAMNLIPSAGNDLSPHQLLFDKIPDVGHLRAFGAECICWTPSSRQHDKLQPRGDVG
jgi:hypothetical protein